MTSFIKYGIILTVLFLSSALANNTVIQNPSQVAPFHLCFLNHASNVNAIQNNHRTITYMKSSQSSPFCLNQNLTQTQYQTLTLFEKDTFVAASMWQYYFNSTHPIWINVRVNNNRGRAGGNAEPGKRVWKEIFSNGKYKRVLVVYPSALTQMLGEAESLTPNMLVTINVHTMANFCFDQTPTLANRSCQQKDVRDVTSVMLHEMGHGYGIRSLRTRNLNATYGYGNFPRQRVSAFDFQTNNRNGHSNLLENYASYFIDHPILFTGKATTNYLKSHNKPYPLRICNYPQGVPNFSQNFAHFCYTSCTSPSANLDYPDLMGMWCLWHIQTQPRLNITDLDLNVLSDIGYAPVLKTTHALRNIRQTLFGA